MTSRSATTSSRICGELIEGSDAWTPRRRDEFVGIAESQARAAPLPAPHQDRAAPRIDLAAAIKTEAGLLWKRLLRTSDTTLTPEDLAAAYKQLLAVERGWRDMKGALRLRPVFHYREDRIRAHIQLCWLALWPIRVVEAAPGDTWRNPRPRTRPHAPGHPGHRHTAPSPNAPRSPPDNERSSTTPSSCPNRPGSPTSPSPSSR